MAIEYRVWNEVGDLFGVHRKRERAEETAERARKGCAKYCETDGEEENPGRGDFRCGVLSPHGISIQVVDGAYDVTSHHW
ncbi:hypothetical protein ACFC1T_08130 [Kitasatospora sp. NPDC056076]|uniref:hypothetical protein n=1 Tax=Kitasatospora sp. NPDC056076 TaxID=3345703 RepID=UPI0035D9843B